MLNKTTSNLRGWMTSGILALAMMGASATSLFAHRPGDFDTTFDGDGWRVDSTVPGQGYDRGQAVLVQTDGKIVTLGTSDDAGTSCSATRHLTDGTLDTSFGNGGKILRPFGPGSCPSGSFMAVHLQSDNKLVVLDGEHLFRLELDGSLDTTFGENGTVSTNNYSTSMAIQGDGKIVVVGYYLYNCDEKGYCDYGFALVRYNSDGSQDTAFGNVQTPLGRYSYPNTTVIQPDGKIVAAGGWSNTGETFTAAIIRYNANGTLDASFGAGGKATPQTSFIRAITLQTDGQIVAAVVDGVARYTAVGDLDASFGNGGVISTPPASAYAIDVQTDGKIVALASPYIRRYNANGSPDPSFGVQGTVTVVNGVPNSFALQSDGKIVGGGYRNDGTNDDFFLTRFDPDGSPDIGGFSGGVVTTDIGNRGLSGSAVAIQADEKVVVAAIALNPNGDDYYRQFAVLRYNPDGSLDQTFGSDGKVTTAFAFKAEAQDIGVQADGKIVVTGFAYSQQPGTFDWAIARYNSDGSLDSTFSEDGKLTLNPNRYSGSVTSLVITADQKLVIGGYSNSGSDGNGFTLIRLNSDGSLDGSFGNSGVVTTAIGPVSEIWDLSIDAAGRIVAVGITYDSSTGSGSFALARYNSDGTLDASLDGDGIVTTSFGAQYHLATSVSIQSDGKMIVAGYLRDDSGYNFAVARYDTDGSLDNSFDGDGKVVTDLGNYDDWAFAMSVQPDGKIIVAGHPGNMVRYRPDGSLDASFGTGGIQHVAGGNYLFGLALDSSNRAIVVSDSLIARVLLEADQTAFDFDGDGRSDVSVFRQSDSQWYIDGSTSGFSAFQFGLSTDRIVPADYDGDGKTDIAIFRDGVWWWMNSHDGTIDSRQWGLGSDVLVPADYTGDGRAELAIFRDGDWWMFDLTDGAYHSIHWGIPSDEPVPGDYDGDGKTDVAIYRDGTWSRLNSSTGTIESIQFGLASDKPVAGDFDGDSRADLAVYRDGTWYLLQSRDGFAAISFGLASDIPAPADYDGDGKADEAVFRNGTWYMLNSTAGVTAQQFGLADDRPIPAAYTQ